jgi:polyisoprenoid-binding protein YceI
MQTKDRSLAREASSNVRKTSIIIAAALLAAACGAPKPRHTEPQPAAPVSSLRGAEWRIDPAQSELRLLVYRAGVMASLGHNHVIVNHSLSGSVRYAGDPAAASFELEVPAGGFVVDDADARKQEGADFAEETPEDAKQGTLHNMLGSAVLDADAHPAITVRSLSVKSAGAALEATVAVSVAGHDSTLTVPFTLDESGGRLHAHGAMAVRQSALGLSPFSIFLGALRVQDELTFKFDLVAAAG